MECSHFWSHPIFWPHQSRSIQFHDDISNSSKVIVSTITHSHKWTLLKIIPPR